jgi:hypothetical protein
LAPYGSPSVFSSPVSSSFPSHSYSLSPVPFPFLTSLSLPLLSPPSHLSPSSLPPLTSSDTDLLAAAMALVNGIVSGEKGLSERMHIRATFKQQLERTFAKQRRAFPKAVSLIRQLDTFEDIEKRDNVRFIFLAFGFFYFFWLLARERD